MPLSTIMNAPMNMNHIMKKVKAIANNKWGIKYSDILNISNLFVLLKHHR